MKPATPKARALLAKLEALAERGINGEKAAAQAKLSKLKARYDFTAPDKTTEDLFKGCFRPATIAQPILTQTTETRDVIDFVKWALEQETGIRCLFRGDQLLAEATPKTAAQLKTIAATITETFTQLWGKFSHAPGVNQADRPNFIRGLYDGVVGDETPGQLLPSRIEPRTPKKRTTKKAVGYVAGLNLHPYSVAVSLGKQIRFCVSLDNLNVELEQKINPPQQIAA